MAACVNIVPGVVSYFKWQKKLDWAKEYLLIIKTDQKKLKQLEVVFSKLNSYTTPEMIAWPIKWSSKRYLNWLSEAIS